MEKKYLRGLIAAPFTPMDIQGNVNPKAIKPYSNLLIDSGVKGAFVCGTTGEGPSLKTEEKKAIIKEWVQASNDDLKIIAHVGGLSQFESMKLAEYSEEYGADAVAAFAPFFFKPKNALDLLYYFKPIAQSAPSLPFYYYHIPVMTGVNIPVSSILKKAKEVIPNFAGVKYTHSDMMDLQQCIKMNNGQYELLFGTDEIMICGLSLGITSAVGSTYNYMAPVYTKLVNAFLNGDIQKARELQQFSVQIVEIIMKYGGGVRGGKAIMELIGINCGPCRSPLKQLTRDEKRSLRTDLKEAGFFEVIELDKIKS